MPLYEFRCDDCGIFDLWRSMSESMALAHCPDCEAPAKRIFSPPAVLSRSLRLKRENPEPQVIKRETEPEASKVRSHMGGRPWMIGH